MPPSVCKVCNSRVFVCEEAYQAHCTTNTKHLSHVHSQRAAARLSTNTVAPSTPPSHVMVQTPPAPRPNDMRVRCPSCNQNFNSYETWNRVCFLLFASLGHCRSNEYIMPQHYQEIHSRVEVLCTCSAQNDKFQPHYNESLNHPKCTRCKQGFFSKAHLEVVRYLWSFSPVSPSFKLYSKHKDHYTSCTICHKCIPEGMLAGHFASTKHPLRCNQCGLDFKDFLTYEKVSPSSAT